MTELQLKGFLALFALTMQNAALAVCMKLSFRPEAKSYSTPLLVLCAECLKLCSCSIIVIALGSGATLKHNVFITFRRAEMGMPSLLYLLQNNLLLLAAKHLSQTAFIVASQGKIITSAIFSVFLLQKRFKKRQVLALGMLAVGIIFVQLRASGFVQSSHSNNYIGPFAMLASNVTSGYAGVYLERLFKKNQEHSIWSRNVQLCIFSVPIALLSTLVHRVHNKNSCTNVEPIFEGFDSVVLTVIALNAVGGLITAFVMRYASAILKCFAVSFSICLCASAEMWFGVTPSTNVLVGMFLVSASIFAYTV